MSTGFPLLPHDRIKKKSDFARLQSGAGKIYSKHFLLIIGPSENGVSRLGLTVTKKVEPLATGRNRLKRRLREIFRRLHADLVSPVDIIVVARQHSPDLTLADVRREIVTALKAHKLIRSKP